VGHLISLSGKVTSSFTTHKANLPYRRYSSPYRMSGILPPSSPPHLPPPSTRQMHMLIPVSTWPQDLLVGSQVMHRMMAPLPDPNTVALQPSRLLLEKAAKRGCTLKFHTEPQDDHSFTVHAFIDLYLLARCPQYCFSSLVLIIWWFAGPGS
jgi:hypothetical protein